MQISTPGSDVCSCVHNVTHCIHVSCTMTRMQTNAHLQGHNLTGFRYAKCTTNELKHSLRNTSACLGLHISMCADLEQGCEFLTTTDFCITSRRFICKRMRTVFSAARVLCLSHPLKVLHQQLLVCFAYGIGRRERKD